MKTKKMITLRFSILAIYVGTFIALISIIIAVSSFFSFRAINYFATTILEDKSNLIVDDLKFKGNSPEILSSFTQFLFENGYVDEKQLFEYSFNVAKNATQSQLQYPSRIVNWLDTRGNSISTFLEPDGTFSTVVFKPNAKPPIRVQFFRNHAGDIRTIKPVSRNYRDDASQYLSAIKAKQFLWTDAFISYPQKNLVTAAVTPIYNKSGQLLGVFSIYISLEGVSNYLKTLKIGKNGVAFLVNGKNELIAFPGMQPWMGNETENRRLIAFSAGDPWIQDSIKHFKATHEKQFVYTYNNKEYIASFKLLPEDITEVASYHWKVGIVVPQSDFTGTLEKNNILMVIIGLSTLLFGITLASIFSKHLSARIKLLVHETEEIKQFNFDSEKVISNIQEVESLASAIHSMKMNLRSFQKYMPAHLVRQLIKSGEDIELGGVKKTLSILFSDIKNFTNISEMTEPEQLMPYLSEYLDNLSHIIIETQGTIDKFIGDSIMAFWGAPLADNEHCEHACLAALLCKKKIDHMNLKWIKQNKMPFITRFGVHTGEVLVGNIGSSERMNYTALGDDINFASRLEGINKIYGTTIIVSEVVKNLVEKKFVFRKIDEVKIKGKSGRYSVYELLAENYEQLSFDLKKYQSIFDKGFNAWQQHNWQEAMKYFKKTLNIYPEDTVSPVFIARCEKAMNTPLG